jgi:hypothetical protein
MIFGVTPSPHWYYQNTIGVPVVPMVSWNYQWSSNSTNAIQELQMLHVFWNYQWSPSTTNGILELLVVF